jgi:hypothetical protein
MVQRQSDRRVGWLREDVTYHYCHPTAEDLSRRVAAFETRLNQDACAVADRLWVKDHLDSDEEKLRFSIWNPFSYCNQSLFTLQLIAETDRKVAENLKPISPEILSQNANAYVRI